MIIEHKKGKWQTVVTTEEWEKMIKEGNNTGFRIISMEDVPVNIKTIDNVLLRDFSTERIQEDNYGKLCEKGRKETDPKKAIQYFKKAQKIKDCDYVQAEIKKLELKINKIKPV